MALPQLVKRLFLLTERQSTTVVSRVRQVRGAKHIDEVTKIFGVRQLRLTGRYDEALVYAARLHREQMRKGTEIPYISHLLAVSALVLEHGGDEDQAIAGLLHDAAEDQGGEATLSEIESLFGPDVSKIVADCTDGWTNPKPPFRERKELYLAHLPQKPQRSCSICAASVRIFGPVSMAVKKERFGITALCRRFFNGRSPECSRINFIKRWSPGLPFRMDNGDDDH
jgi:hypothetical protein